MSPLKQSHNLAARMGRWSAAHRKTAIFGWLAFVIVAFSLSIFMPMHTIDQNDAGVGESGRADKIIDRAFNLEETGLGEFVVVQSDTLTVDDPEFRDGRRGRSATVDTFDAGQNIHSPLDRRARGPDLARPPRGAGLVHTRAALTTRPPGTSTTSPRGRGGADGPPRALVAAAGVSTEKALDELFSSQLARAGLIAIPLTIFILLLVMGTGYGALVPVLLGLTSVLATLGLVSLPSLFVPMDEQISEVILLVGLAVGVDYAIFYMRRERDERRAGRSEDAALQAAAATSGRAVLISGITVMIAMAGMFFSGDKTFMSFAIGSMMVVFVAMIGSLTVLPAILSVLGDRVQGPASRSSAAPAARPPAEAGVEGSRFWGAILRPVLRHPVISTIAATAVLVLLAIPAPPAAHGPERPRRDAQALPALQAFHVMEDAFPGGASAAVVAVRSDDPAPAQSADRRAQAPALASGEMLKPIDVERSADGSTFQVDIPLAGEGTDECRTTPSRRSGTRSFRPRSARSPARSTG